ncbi:glycoside hydrolase family 6 protein [Streptomyces litchfieldiae]|uniref:Glucanase n=1 Tax=Streptomyces litchfieldiae TaxID=3075543 RepID=A0ABU2MVS8_9ACTN|nr:glycoside hydrolase family 6 protein [Streptomyces sp. DSM 44938]MDT0345209.1 glycoside hydrolase family 6 protein [Streptomyces sp. DSM 44938]
MSRNPYLSLRRRLSVVVGGVLVLLAGVLTLALPQQAAADLPSGTSFYRDPNSQVARWTAANQGDSRHAVISQVIDSRPQGIWFSSYRPSTVTADVRAVTDPAAAAGRTPVLVVYQLPYRDCGGASSGGAPDHAAYDRWIDGFAAGLGDDPVVVILEPDSLALTTCLDSSQLAGRNASLSRAGSVIHAANPNARVYYDAGHSAWHSPSAMASRLRAAGVTTNGDGIVSNVSNYRTTSDEVVYAKAVLGQLGDADLGAVIDTSRNGRGPAADSEWCDPPGRGLGRAPTANTGDSQIDAFLWVKPPGEADGCAAAAGQFSAQVAYELALNAGDGGETDGGATVGGETDGGTTDGGATDGGATIGGSADGGTTDGGTGGGCTAEYRVINDWGSGFTGEVTITCDGDSLSGWTVSWTFSGNQRLSQAWNSTCTQQGTTVTCRDSGWNGTVPDGGSVTFGFNATYTGSNPTPVIVLN